MPDIVVIDDHPAICFAVKTLLAPLAQSEIRTATNGITALACIKQHQPELVILDIMLDKMDGLQILQHIRQLTPGVQVIVYTSLPADIYAPRALRAGASAFFNKEADIRQLIPLCQLVLQGYACFPQTTLAQKKESASAASEEDPLALLSDREMTVLRYLATGMSNKEIADRLLLSNKTISTYKRRLLDKLQQESTAGLADLLALSSETGADNA
ncbi:response regulator transcription factor [Erwinia mallotivora]|uniref:LuxR family transcriptional regulator n=1 Tax=Erwinia mallotivora TaxID=69222 RepID=A0A014M6E3_9GAMM|nr:response regulator transcription factor [Erwinia mallotivora]EXU77361.1 LuxR family transcriptional regulator [Erwinia mallotivora]